MSIIEAEVIVADIQDGVVADIQDDVVADIQDGVVADIQDDKLPVAIVIEPQIVIDDGSSSINESFIDDGSSSINEGYIELTILSKRVRVLAIIDLILNLILTINNLIRVIPAILCYIGFHGAKKYDSGLILIYYLYTVLNIAGSLIYCILFIAVTFSEDSVPELLLYLPLLIMQLTAFKYVLEFKKTIKDLTHNDIMLLQANS